MINRLSGKALDNALAELERRLKAYEKARDLRNRLWSDYLTQWEVVHSAG